MKKVLFIVVTIFAGLSVKSQTDSALKNMITEMSSQMSSIKAEVGSFRPYIKKINGIECKVNAVGTQIGRIKTDLKSKITDFTKKVKMDLKDTVDKIKDDLDTAITKVNDNLSSFDTDITQMKKQVDGKVSKDSQKWVWMITGIVFIFAFWLAIKANKRSKLAIIKSQGFHANSDDKKSDTDALTESANDTGL